MRCTQATIASVDDLFAMLRVLSVPGNAAICRGQSDKDWPLQPSLDRDLKPGSSYRQRLDEERRYVEQFCGGVDHLLGDLELLHLRQRKPNDLILPGTVMQHFGAPTRLLDWTRAGHAAAFFAAVDLPHTDGAIWWYHEEALRVAAGEQWTKAGMQDPQAADFDHLRYLFSEESPPIMFPVYLTIPFPRAQAQQGQFTIAGQLGLLHCELLSDLVGHEHFGKIVIPSGLKRNVLAALKGMNVTAKSLEHVGADRLGLMMAVERRRLGGPLRP